MIRVFQALVAVLLTAVPSRADVLSPWSTDGHGAVRLIAGPASDHGKVVTAGLEIKLDDGWKTYWKEPGDSGVPPRFDWSGSENVRDVEVLFPAPQRLHEGTGFAVGYDRGVVLPLRVTLVDPLQRVTLRLKLDYAICGIQCVPSQAEVSLARAPGEAIDRFAAATVTRAIDRVPRLVKAGDPESYIISAERAGDGSWLVAVTSWGTGPVDLFADGKSSWSPSTPVPQGRDGGGRYLFRLKSAKAPAGAPLTLVAVDGDRAIEMPLPLDRALGERR
jgi:DsbC/DsbD-like thiol-disulfide interchange protein